MLTVASGAITRAAAVPSRDSFEPPRLKERASAHLVLSVREALKNGQRASRSLSTLAAAPGVRRIGAGSLVFASDDFLIESAQEPDQERFSVAYTFAAPALQVAPGRQPRLFTYSGTLPISAVQGSSFSRWLASWDAHVRATATVGGSARQARPHVCEIAFRDQVRVGYLVSTSYERGAAFETRVVFSFTMFVVHEFPTVPAREAPVTTTTPTVQVSRATSPDLEGFRQ